ncbi:MAG TPA: hypothetical protein DHW82_02975 [Spirochaetia bacterium]|nr:MAG: hypothetical protein A2Y41_03600 [Spirochaetes bacterium GWB1_36_13]HCL55954.1 hypothetical protein [Spirochaetia bacterium]
MRKFDQRKADRYKTFWKAFIQKEDKKYHFSGYLTEISAAGGRIFIDTVNEDSFHEGQKLKFLFKNDKMENYHPLLKGLCVLIEWIKKNPIQVSGSELGISFVKNHSEDEKLIQFILENFNWNHS